MPRHGRHRRQAAAAAVLTATGLLAACGTGDAGGGSSAAAPHGPVTLTWWHNATADPGKAEWQKVADDYHKAHPKVSFKVTPIQNEQFTSKVPAALTSNNPPDLFQQWGGGAEATQLKSGKLMDLSSAVSGWIGRLGPSAKNWQVDGKWYGVPYDYHLVGFWYRTDLFKRAGISSPPATMDELNADVRKLRSAGITPIAIGSKDRWPDAFYWEYFVLRECPQRTISSSIAKQKFDERCFTKAGEDMKSFLATKPFQDGFLGTPAQQGAGSSAGLVANGKAAMELQGDWEMAVMPSLASDKNFAAKMGWFPFPAVAGGGGDPKAGLGGGDGFSCTTQATSACPDFLKYIASAPVQRQLVKALAVTLPSNPQADDAVTNATLKQVLAHLGKVSYNQLYFDQALPTNVGQALDSAVADYFAGSGSPSDIAGSVAGAAGP
jgi:raffinose/stachyose/melibiose transport system substrate-binding protein